MLTEIIVIIAITLYLAFNVLTAKLYTTKELKQCIIDGQCAVGMVFANVFYAPAWILKLVRHLVVAIVK